MNNALGRILGLVKTTSSGIFGAIAIVTMFLVWGYLHQLFSFADCLGTKPDMSIGSIVASGFGFTICSK